MFLFDRLVLSFVSLICYREFEPFRKKLTNVLAYIAQYTLLITIGVALAIEANLTGSRHQFRFGIALVLTNLVVLTFALCIGVSRYVVKKSKDRHRINSKAQTIENAVSYQTDEWKTTFDKLNRNYIPGLHCLVFWYTSFDSAKSALKSGIPALESIPGIVDTPGIVFTLNNPSDIDPDDETVFPKREVLMACSVRRCLLSRMKGEMSDSNLRVLSGDVLRALRGENFENLTDYEPWLKGEVFLPPQQIVRAYQLVDQGGDTRNSIESGFKSLIALKDVDSLRLREQIKVTIHEF